MKKLLFRIASAVLIAAGCSSSSGSEGVTPEGGSPEGGSPEAGLPTKATVYASVYSHNEDDQRYDVLKEDNGKSPEEQYADYKNYRRTLIALATMVEGEGAVYNFQPEFVFLEAAKRFELDATDTSELFAETNGKNVLKYLYEDLNTMIDPHSHETQGRNMADVAYLISLFGVEPTGVVGGFILFSSTSEDITWERYRSPIESSYYPGYSWQARILWGGAKIHTGGGDSTVEEVVFSGVYRPKSEQEPFEHDPDANLIHIGNAGWGFDAFLRLSEELEAEAEPSEIYTYTLPCFELDIYSEVFGDQGGGEGSLDNSAVLERCREQVRQIDSAGGEKFQVVWQHLDKVTETWKTHYGEAENVLIVPPAGGGQVGLCGDDVCDDQERQSGLCPEDCPD